MLEIQLPEEVENIFAKLAEKKGRTPAYFARKAIMELVEDMEDVDLAMKRLKNPGKMWTLEELEAELDLED